MFGLISMKAIREDFDGALKRMGYVRASVKCKEWGADPKAFQKLIAEGFDCDSFIVNNVRYIAIDTQKPDELPGLTERVEKLRAKGLTCIEIANKLQVCLNDVYTSCPRTTCDCIPMEDLTNE